MTEQEYIDHGDLVSIITIINIMDTVVADNSSVIIKEDRHKLMSILRKWQGRLFLLFDEFDN